MFPTLRLLSLATAVALPGFPAHAQSLPYQLDPQHTKVYWEVKHFGTSTSRGRFDDIEGQVSLDRTAGRGEVSITVGTASVTTGVPPLDAILRGEYFFASKDHPRAYFVSRRLTFKGDQLAELVGELTVRDVSTGLKLTATHFNCYKHPVLAREVCGGDFEGELQRSELGMTYGHPFVADRVRLVVQIEAIAPP